MSKPHKHAALIKAWADGAEVEYLPSNSLIWNSIKVPCWDGDGDYRIKPKPDVVRYVCAATEGMGPIMILRCWADNLKLIFDGETGKLKAAEVLQ